jgi:hypothetical protein
MGISLKALGFMSIEPQFIAELLIWLGRVMPASFLLVLPLGAIELLAEP